MSDINVSLKVVFLSKLHIFFKVFVVSFPEFVESCSFHVLYSFKFHFFFPLRKFMIHFFSNTICFFIPLCYLHFLFSYVLKYSVISTHCCRGKTYSSSESISPSFFTVSFMYVLFVPFLLPSASPLPPVPPPGCGWSWPRTRSPATARSP